MLDGDNHPTRAALVAAREQTMRELSEAFVQDQLSLEELEQRMEHAQTCGTVAELKALTGDLRLDGLQVRVEAPATAALTLPPRASLIPAPLSTAWALLGSVERRVTGPVHGEFAATAVLGSVELDLTDAEFADGVTVLTVNTFCGAVEVLVPDHVRVDCQGTALLASIEGPRHAAPPSPTAPVLRIRGLSLLGSVEVRQRRSLPRPT